MLSKEVQDWDDELYKQGFDCLVREMGEFDAMEFLQLSHMRKTEQSRGWDYTEWRANQPDDTRTLREICREIVESTQPVQAEQHSYAIAV
jgi:hypothetical protein